MRHTINAKCECRVAGAYGDYAEVEGVAVTYGTLYSYSALAGTVKKVVPGAFDAFLSGPDQVAGITNGGLISSVVGYWAEYPWTPDTPKAEIADTGNGTLSFFDTPEALKFRLKLDKDDDITSDFYRYVQAGFHFYCGIFFEIEAPVFQGGFGNSVHPNYDIVWDQKLLQYVMTIRKCGISQIWFALWKEGY
jgi:hypothetical protein